MSSPDRQQFQVRPPKSDRDLGHKLVWRYPLASEDGERALRGLPDMETVTVGYYRLVEPPGAWAFFPVNRPASLAALAVPSVQRRIMDYLVRMNTPQEAP